jgi:hypothetical protein
MLKGKKMAIVESERNMKKEKTKQLQAPTKPKKTKNLNLTLIKTPLGIKRG